MKSMCHDARRNSPSVAVRSPTSSCIRTTSRMAASSASSSPASSSRPAACASRASSSSGGRSRLPTWSARNGGLVRGAIPGHHTTRGHTGSLPPRRRVAPAAGLAGLPLDGAAGPARAAAAAAPGCDGALGAGARRGPRRGGRPRPDARRRGRRRAARGAHPRPRARGRGRRAAGGERARRGLAGERAGPLRARRRSPSGAPRPELRGSRALPHGRRGALPLPDGEARRLPVGQPPQRVAAGAHPLLAVRAGVRPAPGHADVLPGRPAVPLRPHLQLRARPRCARAAGGGLRPRRGRARPGARLPVGHRPARPRGDAVRMTAATTPSQTVGPFFSLGLAWEDGPAVVAEGAPGAVWLRGRVLDGAGEGIPDALVETWQAGPDGPLAAGFRGFGRCGTDEGGRWAIRTVKPGVVEPGSAPHLAVAVFARGLLKHVVTRLYFADEAAANATDAVLAALDGDARATLIAAAAEDGYRFDIRLQGPGETAFFAI